MIGLEAENKNTTQKIDMVREPSIDATERKDRIRSQIKNFLHDVDNIVNITVCNLWDNRYRANVWCKHEFKTDLSVVDIQKIDYSYFIHASEDGTITKSDPKLEKE